MMEKMNCRNWKNAEKEKITYIRIIIQTAYFVKLLAKNLASWGSLALIRGGV